MSEQHTADAQDVLIKYFDGTERLAKVVDREVPYPDGKLIVSRTDPKGIITHANRAFVEMSGYSREELIGTNHCILRHPDIPAVAFKAKSGRVMSRICARTARITGSRRPSFRIFEMVNWWATPL